MSFFLLVLMLVGTAAFAIKTYNDLRRTSERVKRARSDLMGMLRKRITLVNQLIDVCKGYGEHEKLTHLTVAENMTSLTDGLTMAVQTHSALNRVAAIAASFPDLKASTTYEKLMDQLQAVESELQTKREIYNQTVERYNTARASFPTVFVAEALGFPAAPYFETDEEGLETPLSFQTDDGALLKQTVRRLGDTAALRTRDLAR